MAKKTEEKKPDFNISGMRVANVRKLSETVIAFSLLGNGLGLYNLKVVDGAKGKFVAVPQAKGKDDEWYNQYALYLSEEDQEKLIEKVLDEVEDEEEEKKSKKSKKSNKLKKSKKSKKDEDEDEEDEEDDF